MKGYGLGRWLRLATMTALAKVEEKVAFPKFRLELHPLMLLTSNLSTSIILRSQRILCMTYKVNQLSKGILFISENKLGQQATLWNKWAETESKTHCGLVKIATFQISYCRGIPICVLKRKLVSSLTAILVLLLRRMKTKAQLHAWNTATRFCNTRAKVATSCATSGETSVWPAIRLVV